MFSIKNSLTVLTAIVAVNSFYSCSEDNSTQQDLSKGQYVIAINTSTIATESANYIVQTNTLENGSISTIGNGIEQSNFRTFYLSGQTLLSVGGVGDVTVLGYAMNESRQLVKTGQFAFDKWLDEYTPVGDGSSGVGASYSRIDDGEEFGKLTLYNIDAKGVAIKDKQISRVNILSPNTDAPYITGLKVRDNRVYISYYLVDAHNVSKTNNTDTAYVAIYSYPGFQFEKVIKDSHTGPAGSFYTHQGLIATENGDLYTVSGCAIYNGYSQSTKPSGFLRIKSGATTFDPDYFFNFSELSGGYRISHASYVGNGLVLAEIHTVKEQSLDKEWWDLSLKTAIIDIYNKKLTYVDGIPVHDGVGAGQYVAFKDANGKVYTTLKSTGSGATIYEIDLEKATAKKTLTATGSNIFCIYKM